MRLVGLQRLFLFGFFLFLFFSAYAAVDKTPVVFVKSASAVELFELLHYPARVEPKIRAAVLTESEGVIAEIKTPLGKRVKAGQALIVVRNTDPVYKFAPAIVTAPVSGVVSQVDVSVGSRVGRGDKVLLLTDPSQLRLSIEVAASDLSSIKVGLTGELEILNQNPIQVKVKGVSPFVDPTTGTATCELEVVEAKKSKSMHAPTILYAGFVGKVTFKANVRQGYSIPDSAITYRGRDTFVRLIENNKSKLTAVVIGRKQAGLVEILKGIKSGDQVVERSSGFIADGETVKVESEAAKKSSTESPQG